MHQPQQFCCTHWPCNSMVTNSDSADGWEEATTKRDIRGRLTSQDQNNRKIAVEPTARSNKLNTLLFMLSKCKNSPSLEGCAAFITWLGLRKELFFKQVHCPMIFWLICGLIVEVKLWKQAATQPKIHTAPLKQAFLNSDQTTKIDLTFN